MQKYDIIGDIHGHAEELKELLEKLGYARDANGTYQPPEQGRKAIFTGDFIDRGTANFEVIDIVRDMVEAGNAHAIMGNHDLNAGLFHAKHPEEGTWLRPRINKNVRQHQAFMKEASLDPREARKNIQWLKSLPVCLEFDGLRFVHALWDQSSLDYLRKEKLLREDNTIDPDRWHELAVEGTPGCDAIELLTKGFEVKLEEGVTFADQEGTVRDKARLKWWANPDKPNLMLHEAILDVPAESIPDKDKFAPDDIKNHMRRFQQLKSDTVFFGHYWQTGEFPTVEAKNAICIDQSVAKDGHLAAATVTVDQGKIVDMRFSSVKSRMPDKPIEVARAIG